MVDGKNLDSCVMIRFIEKEGDQLYFKSGGGITHMSKLEDEYQEMKIKSMSQFIESIKVEDQEMFLLEFHQKRVNDTFAHFGKEGSIDLEKIFKNLNHDEDGLYKLRTHV